MPLQKLQFRPGVNREGTTLSNEGGWFDCDKIRFRSGYPEKIGGWQRDGGSIYTTSPTGTLSSGGTSTSVSVPSNTGAYWGIAKALWNWINLTGYNLLSVGTNLKYYIQNSSGGAGRKGAGHSRFRHGSAYRPTLGADDQPPFADQQ